MTLFKSGTGSAFDSSPESVTALSRFFRRSSSACIDTTGAERLDDGPDGGGEDGVGAPPPNSINSSAHSHDILYLMVIACRVAAICLCSANVFEPLDVLAGGDVWERSREPGRARLNTLGDVARDGGALSRKVCTSASSCW